MWARKIRYCVFVIIVAWLSVILCKPQKFHTKDFKIGIEYDHSLPMSGGSDRYRHRNNCDPFFVTVNVSARKGYVISYLEVSVTVDEQGDVEFYLKQGQTGSKYMVFQMISNNSEFLSYSYMTYGIKESEYKKIMNIVSLPMQMTNYATTYGINLLIFLMYFVVFLLYRFTT